MLIQDKEDSWKGKAIYDGHAVEIELSVNDKSFEEIAAYASSVITEESLPRSKMNDVIARELEFLTDKFKRFNVSVAFKADELIPRQFYFYKRRHHDSPEMIIGLDHPADAGHWSLTFYDLDDGHLNWVPKD